MDALGRSHSRGRFRLELGGPTNSIRVPTSMTGLFELEMTNTLRHSWHIARPPNTPASCVRKPRQSAQQGAC